MMFKVIVCSCLLFSMTVQSELIVEKKRFEVDEFTTFGGKTIKQVTVGYESYGELNSKKDNVILITHYFSANSHAAGKYEKDDPQAGYWDAVIGPNKAIDTNEYFVISVDSLVNLNANDPHTITTGPASINPDTGKPYGLDFPVVTIRDFVNVQKAVLESLGIRHLHAVIGASMGSMQAIDWAAAYPNWVPRMISIVGSGETDDWGSSMLEQWAIPIRLDPNWQQGNYYDSKAPLEGLTTALMFITQAALTPEFFNQVGQGSKIDRQQSQIAILQDINQLPAIVTWLRDRAKQRASLMDANHLLYLVRANQLFVAGHKGDLSLGLKAVKAKTLFLPSSTDLLLMPYLAQRAHNILIEQGKQSELIELQGNLGHLNGVSLISQQGDKIKQFLHDEMSIPSKSVSK
jgi:homoserine O-acetyltransferase/O-succinyltransferase